MAVPAVNPIANALFSVAWLDPSSPASRTVGTWLPLSSLPRVVRRHSLISSSFKLAAIKLMSPSKEHLEKHYEDLSDKPFFPGLIACMSHRLNTPHAQPTKY